MHKLKALISEGKTAQSKALGSNQTAGWVKRSDLLACEEVGDDRKHNEHRLENDETRKLEMLAQTYSRSKRIHPNSEAGCSDSKKKGKLDKLDINFVNARLRELNQPLKLYGEREKDVIARYQEVVSRPSILTPRGEPPVVDSDVSPASVEGHGGEMCDDDNGDSASKSCAYNEISEIPMTLREDLRIRAFVKTCLTKWANELNSRPVHERESPEGRREASMYNVTRKDLRPLLRKIQDRQLEDEVAAKLADIVNYCIIGDYIKAHDKYIELAIGNAAWPMGVTMVGIHERVGRSKIASSEIAHILNDETTRKYIQMVKRLLTICQRWFPTDPSKMVQIATTPESLASS